jgi:uncharacterized protein (TIGR00299 family) protein
VRIAYFDCFSGISGDMALAALVHAGADLESIAKVLAGFPIEEFLIEREETEVHGISALRLQVRAPPQEVIHTYVSIRAMLDEVDMPDGPRRSAHRIYRRLAEAVARVHGKELELVTFNEFGELDCIVDIVGCALAMDMLHIDRVFASPIPTGLGMIRTEHGMHPIPAPVVLELLQAAPTYSRGIPVQLVSPTGAAILSAVSEGYGDMPMMRAEQVGYGAGHPRPDFPNVLRIVIGEEQRIGAPWPGAEAPDVLVEASIDALGSATSQRILDDLFAAGAADAWTMPASGPGGSSRLVVSAVGSADARAALVQVLQSLPGAGPVRSSPTTIAQRRPHLA